MQSAVLVSPLGHLYRLFVAAVVVAAFFAVSVPFAQADEVADLRAQVSTLEQRVASLEGGAVLGTTIYCPAIVQNLRRGMSDTVTVPTGQITELQKFLASYYSVPTASIVVGTFGPITSGYVMDFQQKQGIESTGNVAAQTRRAIAAVCAGTVATTTPNAPSIVSFTGPSTLATEQVGTWTITATNPIDYYHIDWRDGEQGGNNNFSGTKTILTHQYKNPGTYTIVLAARGPGGRATTTATVTVTGPAAPTITSFTGPSTLKVKEVGTWTINAANTVDSYHIDWRDGEEGGNNNFSGTKTTLTHHYNAPGTYTIILAARGPGGRATTTRTVIVTAVVAPIDTTAPAVSITAPAANASVSGTLTITAGATDAVGVSSVRFYVDGTLFRTDLGAPYLADWKTTEVTNGSHTLAAVGSDKAGNTATTTISVTVANPDTRRPAVSLTAPKDGAKVSGTVVVSADASDDTGIVGVQFKVNRINIGAEDTTAPYTINWNSKDVSKGSYNVTATARDAAGNITVSNAHTISVNNTTASVDYSGMMAAAVTAPFSILVDQLTELFIYAGIGQ